MDYIDGMKPHIRETLILITYDDLYEAMQAVLLRDRNPRYFKNNSNHTPQN